MTHPKDSLKLTEQWLFLFARQYRRNGRYVMIHVSIFCTQMESDVVDDDSLSTTGGNRICNVSSTVHQMIPDESISSSQSVHLPFYLDSPLADGSHSRATRYGKVSSESIELISLYLLDSNNIFLSMFIGEMMCLVAHYAYSHYSTRKTSSAYEPIAQHDDQDEERSDIDPVESHSTIQPLAPLTLSASLLFILPTLCDLTGTTLMNVGLIYTPVSIYQMTRGLLVLWVGILSVMFLKRRLEAYQWVCLVLVTAGVALVGLAGSLVKRAVDPTDVESSLVLRGLVQVATAVGGQDDPTRVLVGVLFIACAQIFTAAQFVSSGSVYQS